jgi:hypothetical protein
MPELSDTERRKILEALKEAGAILPCPRCANRSFGLIDGYFNPTVQTSVSSIMLGGTTVPSIVVVCNRCGYLAQHALGGLGLLHKKDTGQEEGKNE